MATEATFHGSRRHAQQGLQESSHAIQVHVHDHRSQVLDVTCSETPWKKINALEKIGKIRCGKCEPRSFEF